MTVQRFLHWVIFSQTIIDELSIYEQNENFAYTQYKGGFDSILEKTVTTIDWRTCDNHTIVAIFIK